MSFDDTTVPGKPTIVHDPDANLDYTWGMPQVEGDTIVSVEFVVPTGATIVPGTVSAQSAVGWLSITDKPALAGKTIGVTCRYTSAQGRVDDRTLYFKIKDK